MSGIKTFFHNMKYTVLCMLRAKSALFWTLVFPIALATFMYIAFGNLYEKDEVFKTIDVAVVESENDDAIMSVLSACSELINVEIMDSDSADQALKDKKVTGIIHTKDASLVVDENSYNATILESILNQYKQQEDVITKIAKEHPEKLETAVQALTDPAASYTEIASSSGNQNEYNNYFYAVFAMSCLFSSFSAVTSTCWMLANSSPLGMRRCLVSTNKTILIISEYVMLLLIHFAVELISLGYMILIGVDFGTKYPAIIATLFFGCMIGLAIGVIIGALPKVSYGGKIGISVGFGMFLSVLADLCASGIKDMVEHKFPIANRINPACLISDCFYSLNVYDNYDRFFRNITILGAESIVLLVIAFILLRREKYASL